MLQPPTLQQIKALVDGALNEFFTSQEQKASQIDASYGRLWQELSRLGLRGGKRFRPYLTILAYCGFGGKKLAEIMPVATAMELLHLSLLIHDDIIDRDDLRYGQDNISGRYKKYYRRRIAGIAEADTYHYALSSALLAGDMMLSASYQLIAASNLAASKKTAVNQELASAVFEVMAGELLDTEAVFLSEHDSKQLKVMRYKTASYSCILPLTSGAIVAGAKPADLSKLSQAGEHLGIACQLRDDYLGIFGDDTRTGKPVLSDLAEGKQTYLIRITRQKVTSQQKKQLDNLLAEPKPTRQHLKQVRRIIENSGILEPYEAKIKSHATKAVSLLNATTMQPAFKQAFTDLIKSMLWRNS